MGDARRVGRAGDGGEGHAELLEVRLARLGAVAVEEDGGAVGEQGDHLLHLPRRAPHEVGVVRHPPLHREVLIDQQPRRVARRVEGGVLDDAEGADHIHVRLFEEADILRVPLRRHRAEQLVRQVVRAAPEEAAAIEVGRPPLAAPLDGAQADPVRQAVARRLARADGDGQFVEVGSPLIPRPPEVRVGHLQPERVDIRAGQQADAPLLRDRRAREGGGRERQAHGGIDGGGQRVDERHAQGERGAARAGVRREIGVGAHALDELRPGEERASHRPRCRRD